MLKHLLKCLPVLLLFLASSPSSALDATSVAFLRSWCADVDNAAATSRDEAYWCIGYIRGVADQVNLSREACTGAAEIDVVIIVARAALATSSDGAYAAEVVADELHKRFPCE